MKYYLKLLIISLSLVILFQLINISIINYDKYEDKLKTKSKIIVFGNSAPRGRILDVNGKVIVGNKKINTIYYHSNLNITKKDIINIVNELSKYVVNCTVTDNDLKEYWIFLYPENANALITDDEYELYNMRKLTKSDIEKLKKDRINNNELSKINKNEAYLFSLINKNYDYANIPLLKNLSEEDFANIIEKKLPSIYGGYTWERIYPYDDILKSILGSIGSIPKEKANEYLENGYSLDDIVGLSYLELQYEDLLKGKKAIYEVGKNNKLNLIEEAIPGEDLILSIDIDKQLELEKILKKEITKAKKEVNTMFYKESYAIISNPNNGNIIAMSGKRYIKDNDFDDVTNNIINTSYTMGSVVKGATISVGYKYNIINIGTKMRDSCVKLYNVPQKCSFKRLGMIDDQTAIMNSSNYYQFMIAIGVTNNKYSYNMKLNTTKEHFDIYRNTLKEYGLGGITGIDLPNEKTGIEGSLVADDLLLNLAIGQYDTYTPIELLQYINTIANGGYKYAPSLKFDYNKNYISKIDLDPNYLNRIKEGLHLVLLKGTGRGYVKKEYDPAGKTGTSESFYDSNNDNINDIKTITKTFAGYFPSDNPKYSLVVVSPNVSYDNKNNSYISDVNRHITRSIADFLFEK